ncbi:pentatricopeptide repeat-containing protein At1g62720-like [Argentina anserina]|uniref:pentatricopeptide repeat-containing protein At1g62720-like n=1 Tax=Argentina anserina TaxID=57926 RepID=UPI0021768F1B|nr:pentatricopeptide repeat-containing protein At1g62720-like [Potentilla anserina]
MVSQGISPDIYTFTVLVDTLSKEGKVEEAKTVLDVMNQRGIQSDMITYSSLMNGYCLQGEMDQARQVFDLMISKGSMVDVHSCSKLIKGYCQSEEVDQAHKIFQEMTCWELVPNTVTFNTLIDGSYKAGRIRDMQKSTRIDQRDGSQQVGAKYRRATILSSKLKLRNCYPKWRRKAVCQMVVPTTQLSGVLNNNEISKATVLMKEMRKKGFSGDATTMRIAALLSKAIGDPELLAWLKDSD